jgi:23S rRNA (adenine2503-C2)-methyltransferase
VIGRPGLKNARVSATLRLERGRDLAAACGQLRLKQQTAEGTIPGSVP